MRAAAVVAGAGLLLLAVPGVASADVVFDPADADELAAVLTEATTDQDVCYGWDVQVDDAVSGRDSSVGSNFGAGQPVSSGSCSESVELKVYITYTSESSESEDSASYDVVSSSGGPTRADMEALGLDTDGLAGENPDVVIGKMVAALPLLAADKGLAKGIEAAPATGTAPADAQLTDNPGSDWWRNSGGMLLWGVGLLLAGGVFAWWVVKTNRRYKPSRRAGRAEQVPTYVPDTVPAEFYDQQPTTPVAAQGQPSPDTDPTQPVTKETIEKAAADKAALEERAAGGTPAARAARSRKATSPESTAGAKPAADAEPESTSTKKSDVDSASSSTAAEPGPAKPAPAGAGSEKGSGAAGSTSAKKAGTDSVSSPATTEPGSMKPTSGESGTASGAAGSTSAEKSGAGSASSSTAFPSEEARPSAAPTPPSAESAEPPSSQANESAADKKDKE